MANSKMSTVMLGKFNEGLKTSPEARKPFLVVL
jgi:hypothetical protein